MTKQQCPPMVVLVLVLVLVLILYYTESSKKRLGRGEGEVKSLEFLLNCYDVSLSFLFYF